MNVSEGSFYEETNNDDASYRALSVPEIKDFIEERSIKEEDYSLILQAHKLPKQIFIENHNTASLLKERLVEDMEARIARIEGAEEVISDKDEDNLTYCKVMKEVAEKYDWPAAWHLNSVLEKNKQIRPSR